MQCLITFIVVHNLYCSLLSDAVNAERNAFEMKNKIMQMEKELIYDAMSKVNSIQSFKSFHDRHRAYIYGSIAYEIRMRYARMIFIFKNTALLSENMTIAAHVTKLVEIDYLTLEVDNFVNMIESSESQEIPLLYEQVKLRSKLVDYKLVERHNLGKEKLDETTLRKKKIWNEPLTHIAYDTPKIDALEDGFDTDTL